LSSAEVYGSLSVDPDPDDEADLLINGAEGDPRRRFSVDAARAGERLDKALVQWMPDISRTRLKQWVEDGAVRVNGAVVRPRHELATGDLVELEPQPAPDAKAYRLLIADIVTAALCESVAIYGLVMFLLVRQIADFYTLVFISLAYFLYFFPRYSQWKNTI